ncbi:MAG: iron-containing alcohol dehydrogenase [Bryobacterales bacterium]|nr:iron-containing alcohol dehydrogenase [Bryobacteraceae bacterium]MDW8130821.1 iron-containing alcohol dehydrogenase [Bryobacterales bacterium]
MRLVTLLQPRKIVVGADAIRECCQDLEAMGLRRILVVSSPDTASFAEPLLALPGTQLFARIDREPTFPMFEQLLGEARQLQPDAVVGLGGGSVLDAAKLAAALADGAQQLGEVLGIGRLARRRIFLACLPTTSGTGSEVSPNAILLDPSDRMKKAVISPHLVPDAAYLDPLLTVSMPPAVTASSGMDALTHCIECYANRASHPAVDLYALEGIRLAGRSLERAVRDGRDLAARQDMMLASLYGGLCLGPVNTAAVHALAYPLGGEFEIPHGISNAVLLPYVLAFNLPAMPDRYAEVAVALGVPRAVDLLETARGGIRRIREMLRACGLPDRLGELGIPESAIPRMVESAMTVTRLLRNNPREVTPAEAERIYRAALTGDLRLE